MVEKKPLVFERIDIKYDNKINSKNWISFRATYDKNLSYNMEISEILSNIRKIGNGIHPWYRMSSVPYYLQHRTIDIAIRKNRFANLISVYILFNLPIENVLEKKKELGL